MSHVCMYLLRLYAIVRPVRLIIRLRELMRARVHPLIALLKRHELVGLLVELDLRLVLEDGRARRVPL